MKAKNDYFALMKHQAGYCVRAAELLKAHLSGFDRARVVERRAEMHALENEADKAKHELMKKLSREFVTPIERDDILQLVQIIDDVTDKIDDVSLKFYMLCLSAVTPDMLRLADEVARCARALTEAIGELGGFKKPDRLEKLVIDINNIEGEADGTYIEAVRALYASGQPGLSALSTREIYECLEGCCDLCEHAADVIESIIMRNT